MVASDVDPGRKTGEVAQAQFEKLGFKIKFRTASQAALGTKFCGLPAAKVAICPDFSFTRDYNDPQGLLDPVFNGRNIMAANNANWSQLDDPALNRAMDAAARVPAGPARDRAWGAVDRMATEQAPGIPFLWDTVPIVEAADVRGVANAYTTGWDLSFTSLK
jgi:peptide/nickel transport system substrate-binding protein